MKAHNAEEDRAGGAQDIKHGSRVAESKHATLHYVRTELLVPGANKKHQKSQAQVVAYAGAEPEQQPTGPAASAK